MHLYYIEGRRNGWTLGSNVCKVSEITLTTGAACKNRDELQANTQIQQSKPRRTPSGHGGA